MRKLLFYYKAEYEPCAMIQWIALVMMCLGSGTALLNIRDGNVALSDSVNYDAASNSWTLGFNKVPAYTSILPQLCNKTAGARLFSFVLLSFCVRSADCAPRCARRMARRRAVKPWVKRS